MKELDKEINERNEESVTTSNATESEEIQPSISEPGQDIAGLTKENNKLEERLRIVNSRISVLNLS